MYRILYNESSFSIGGSAFSLLQLLRKLDRGRFEPFVLFRYDLQIRDEFEKVGIPTATFASIAGRPEDPPPDSHPPVRPWYKHTRPYRLLWSIKKYIREQKPEADTTARWMERHEFSLLHTNDTLSSNLPALVAADRVGLPAVCHQRSFYTPTSFQRFVTRRAKCVICVSKALYEHCIKVGFNPDRLRVVYNGIDLSAVHPVQRNGSRVGHTIGWFGRLERIKGLDTLLDGARIVLDRRRDVRFIIVGTGPEADRVQTAVEADGFLAGGVELLGYRSDALGLLATCDISTSTSTWPEALPRSCIESLASGVPLIASNVGGNREIVEDGVSGLLFDPGDGAGLAAAILRLLENSALRSRLAREGRRRAEALFSAERHAREIERIYREVLGP